MQIPRAQVPSYRPLVLPSASQMRQVAADEIRPQEPKEEPSQEEAKQKSALPRTKTEIAPNSEITTITLPGTSMEIPVPRAEIVSTAVVTAGASAVAAVAGTLVAGQVLQYLKKILKPLMKTALKRLATARGKTPTESDAKQKWRRHVRKVHAARNRA